MARKSGSTILQEELYPHDAAHDPGPDLDDSRLLDLDVAEEESPFLRGQKLSSVRRPAISRKMAMNLAYAGAVLTLMVICSAAVAALYHYGEHSWRFRVESSDDIATTGLHNVQRKQVIEVMGGDIGRNIFFIPLAQRQEQIEQIPWVETATLMRFVPNRLAIDIHERTPVAFARVGSKIMLTDASGALMDLPQVGRGKYSFPVIIGTNPGEPISTRAARMKIYGEFERDLNSDGVNRIQDLSEVDLTDPSDVKILASEPENGVLVHLGSSNYLERYKTYVAHIREWRQQFAKLESVDLRFDRQIIVNPDLQGVPHQAPLPATAERAAVGAGVKQAALITHPAGGPRPKPAKAGIADETLEKASDPPSVPAKHAAKSKPAKLHAKTKAHAHASSKAQAKKITTHPATKAAASNKPVKPSPIVRQQP